MFDLEICWSKKKSTNTISFSIYTRRFIYGLNMTNSIWKRFRHNNKALFFSALVQLLSAYIGGPKILFFFDTAKSLIYTPY